jgi:hypothetical protein
MASFYDTANDSDLARVENLLSNSGTAYSLRILGNESPLKEIMVAEEDLTYAEWLLSNTGPTR